MTNLKIKLREHTEYIRALSDLFHVENALEEALPKMAGAAASTEVASALRQHHAVTREHARRLNDILRNGIEVTPMDMPGNSVTPLVNEGDQLIEQQPMGGQRDAALLALARRVEQKEMSLYDSVLRAAPAVGLPAPFVDVLAQSRREEEEADATLAQLQQSMPNLEQAKADPRGF